MAEQREATIERLAAFPARLAGAAGRVESAEPGGPPAGEWSAREVVGHLVAVEAAVWQARLDQLAADPAEPAWSWWEPAPVTDPAAATLEGALGLFAAARAATMARVAALDEAGWARTGAHAVYGRLDVAALLRVAADHDEEHLAGLAGREPAGDPA
jgi:hypothetical protein